MKRLPLLVVVGVAVLAAFAPRNRVPTYVIQGHTPLRCECRASFAPQMSNLQQNSWNGLSFHNVGTFCDNGTCDDSVLGPDQCSTKKRLNRYAIELTLDPGDKPIPAGQSLIASGSPAFPATIGGVKFVHTDALDLTPGRSVSLFATRFDACGQAGAGGMFLPMFLRVRMPDAEPDKPPTRVARLNEFAIVNRCRRLQ